MRTTVTLDDDVLRAARSLARARSVSLGAALSELARRGLREDQTIVADDGLPVFRVPPGARPITLEDVRKLEDEA
ncbi:MAG: antitoxin [Armatimonadetes bacterium]|nr:antitoxin [Armatimonadota bacterium]